MQDFVPRSCNAVAFTAERPERQLSLDASSALLDEIRGHC